MNEKGQTIKLLEIIHSAAVKVLEWENNSFNFPRTIILFRLHNNAVELVNEPITSQEFFVLGHPFLGCLSPPLNTDAYPFFSNPDDPVSFNYEFVSIISNLNIFNPNNCNLISKMIFENFRSCFDFNRNFMADDNSTSPKVVFVIDVYRTLVHVDLPNGVKLEDHKHIDIDRDKLVGLTERVGKCFDIVQGEAFLKDELQHILWTLCHRVKIGHVHLNSAKTHANMLDRLSQVKPAIRTLMFGEEKDYDVENQCAICWEQFCKGGLIVKMPCSHIFHKGCAFKWLVDHSSCPLCRSTCKTSIFS